MLQSLALMVNECGLTEEQDVKAIINYLLDFYLFFLNGWRGGILFLYFLFSY